MMVVPIVGGLEISEARRRLIRLARYHRAGRYPNLYAMHRAGGSSKVVIFFRFARNRSRVVGGLIHQEICVAG